MYKLLGILNGVLIAIMIILNGLLAEATSVMYSVAIMNMLGLVIITLIIVIKRVKLQSIKVIPIYLLFTGLISLMNVGLNSVSFIHLGAALTIGLIMYGQLLASSLVDHFGLFGMNKHPFKPKKYIGLFIMSIGVLIMILY